MRVIGGTARGRPLAAPKSASLRPTSDRVREAIFDVLESLGVIEGAEALDLFAGTGAFGIEALSRGAARVTFVEQDRRHAEALRNNLRTTGLDELPHEVVVRDALRFVEAAPRRYDVAFVDPPYAFSEWPRLLAALPGEIVVLESNAAVELGVGHDLHRIYRYGTTIVTVARRAEGAGTGRGGGSPA